MTKCTRFAPSPTGLLHVGNAYSALCCQQWAFENSATLLLRIEDIDHTRCRPQFIDHIYRDLNWLGLSWQKPVRLQSQQLQNYRDAIELLRQDMLIYPCFCTRKSIQNEMESMAIAPHAEEHANLYPGICRKLPISEQQRRMADEPFAWRLDTHKAMATLDTPLQWTDGRGVSHNVEVDHDVVIGRKDISFSYHLSVVVDDSIQGVSHIIRGEDLLPVIGIHRLLQHLLGLPEPIYIHHPLIKTTTGQRLAKRSGATTLSSLRNMGVNSRKLANYLLNLPDYTWPIDLESMSTKQDKMAHLLGNS